MKINPSLIWNLVGDGFGRAFDIQQKRSTEALWQGMFDTAKDAVSYSNHIANLQNPFTATVFAPWGKILVYPEEVDSSEYFESYIVGDRIIWSRFEIPERGFIKNNNTSIEYRVLSVLDSMGGYIYHVEYLSNLPTIESSSSFSDIDEFFVSGSGTKTETDNGLKCDVDWVNWVILLQKTKISPVKSWKQRWFTRVTNWDSGFPSKRSMSVNSIADIGVNYELRLEDDGSNVYVSYGTRAQTRYVPLSFSGNTITRVIGSFFDDGFKEGQNFEIENTINDGDRQIVSMTSKVITVSGSPFTTNSTNNAILRSELDIVSSAVSNTWRNTLRRASDSNPVRVDFEVNFDAKTSSMSGTVWVNDQYVSHGNFSVRACERYNGIDIFNQRNNVQVYLEGISLVEGMMSDGSEPDITTSGEEYSFVYKIEEPIVNCKRLQIDAWDMNIQAEILSINDGLIQLEIDEYFYGYAPEVIKIDSSALLLVDKNDAIANYELKIGQLSLNVGQVITIKPWNTYDFVFIDDSTFVTKDPLYSDAIFLVGAEAREVDLYSRFGKVLELSPEKDSESYLDYIRGSQFMRLSAPNYENIKNAISMMGGAPFSNFSGVLTSITPINNSLGGIVRYQAVVGENSVDVTPYWYEFLKINGSRIGLLETIVKDTVSIYDWKNGLDVLLSKGVNPWSIYGTTLIAISDKIGFTGDRAADLIKSLRKSLPKDVDFIIEYGSNRQESGNDQNRNRLYQEIEYSNENIATIVDDLGFPDYGEVVQNPLDFQTIDGDPFGEEYQYENPLVLDGGASLDETRTLNADWYRYVNIIDTKNKKSGIYTQPKGYSLLWTYEGNTDTLTTFNSGRWYEMTVASAPASYSDCYIDANRIFYATGSDGKIYESTDGYNFTGKTVTSATGIAQRIRDGWAFGYSSGVLQKRDISGNWSEITVAAISGTPKGLSVINNIVYVFWGVGSTVRMIKSLDGGSTWSSASTIHTAGGAIDVSDSLFFSETNGIVATSNDGILFTSDGGSSWTQYESTIGYSRPTLRNQNEVYIGETPGSDYHVLSDFNGGSISVGSAVPLGIGGDIDQFAGGERYLFVVMSTGDVYRSTDSGNTWDIAMTGVGTGQNIEAVATSSDGLIRMAAGDRIWRWF